MTPREVLIALRVGVVSFGVGYIGLFNCFIIVFLFGLYRLISYFIDANILGVFVSWLVTGVNKILIKSGSQHTIVIPETDFFTNIDYAQKIHHLEMKVVRFICLLLTINDAWNQMAENSAPISAE